MEGKRSNKVIMEDGDFGFMDFETCKVVAYVLRIVTFLFVRFLPNGKAPTTILVC